LNENSGFINKAELESYFDTYVRVVGSSFRKTTQYDSLLSTQEALENIDKFCSHNKRLAMNLMGLFAKYCLKDTSLTNYLTNIRSKDYEGKPLSDVLQFGYYRFFEALMLDNGFCRLFNGYDQVNGKLAFNNRNGSSTENRFLANLFEFPSKVGITSHYSVFVKIRILQLLAKLRKPIEISEIIVHLKETFGYSENVIDLSCQILVDGCCAANYDEDDFDQYPAELKPIEITKRGRVVLDTFPEKVNYLSICYEAMPIPEDFLETSEGKLQFPMSNYFSAENALNTFLLENVLYSTPVLIGMLEVIEAYEKNKFLNNAKAVKAKLFSDTDFTLVERLKENALATYGKIIDSYVIPFDRDRRRYDYYLNNLPKTVKQ
jgi:hypothetical protein